MSWGVGVSALSITALTSQSPWQRHLTGNVGLILSADEERSRRMSPLLSLKKESKTDPKGGETCDPGTPKHSKASRQTWNVTCEVLVPKH